MTEFPFISVIIPTRNRARLLADTIVSVRAQDYPAERFEIIVVDDGSTDGTEKLVKPFQDGRLARVHYLRQPPRGLNAARNVGFSHARGAFAVFIDDDVAAVGNWLSAYAAAFRSYPDAAVYGGPVHPRIEGDGPLPAICGGCGTFEELEIFDQGPTDAVVPKVIGANFVVRRATMERIGSFDENIQCWYGDETEWLLRARQSKLSVRYVSLAKVWHRRPSQELPRMLVTRRYLKSKGGVLFAREFGGKLPAPGRLVRRFLRYQWHYWRHGCFLGQVKAAEQLGQLVGLVQWVLRQTFKRRGLKSHP